MKKNILLLMTMMIFTIVSRGQTTHWSPQVGVFPYNMTCTFAVSIDGVEMRATNIEVGAFCGNDCRGAELLSYDTRVDKYFAFLTVYGENNDVIKLRLYDHATGQEIFVNENTFVYQDNANTGDPFTIKNFTSPTFTFNGEGSWSSLSNWNVGGSNPEILPTVYNNLVIDANVTIEASTVAYANNLTINSDKTLTINAGGSLRIDGTLTNSGAIRLEASAPSKGALSKTASLLHETSGINGTVECYLDNSKTDWDWHLLSSPVAAQSIDGEFTPSGTNNDYDFFMFNEPTSVWFNKKSTNFGPANGSNFVVGRGYLVAYQAADNKPFTGILNEGEISVPLTSTGTGFNLVGNPYPSYIDWESDSWDRSNIYGYSATPANNHPVYWVYDQDESNYSIYVKGNGGITTLGATRYIAPCQGFFVKATAAGNLVMNNDVRTNTMTGSGFRGEDEMSNVIKLRVKSEKHGSDEVVIGYGDEFFGADKMYSRSKEAPSLYLPYEDEKYSIVVFEESNRGETAAMNFEAGVNGFYTISLNEDSRGAGYVELVDRMTGDRVNLSVEDYTFTAQTGDNPERFEIRFFREDYGGVESENFVYLNGNDLIVNAGGEVRIMDLMGRMLVRQVLGSNGGSIDVGRMSDGIYVISIESEGKVKTQKLIINK